MPNHSPLHYGYDYFYGISGPFAGYFDHTEKPGDKRRENGLWDNNTPVSREGYLTDIIADKAIDQIRAPHLCIDCDRDKAPFFLSVHFNAPHWPWEGPHDKGLVADAR